MVKITAHCLIRNEERWIWYAIKSVIDYVDNILIFDTGSTDKTVKIIKSIKSPKIIFEQKGIFDKRQYTALRQEMLDRTKTEWFLILDGDEGWRALRYAQGKPISVRTGKDPLGFLVLYPPAGKVDITLKHSRI